MTQLRVGGTPTFDFEEQVNMTVTFQTPGKPTTSLLQELSAASVTATAGGGIFAWATRYGVSALMSNPDFESFLNRAPFDLIVGTDSITDQKALDKLAEFAAKHPKLTVRALLNDGRALFHPKFTWFDSPTDAVLILGSGNLTNGGLFSNWEAFATSRIPQPDKAEFFLAVDDWLDQVAPGILPITDPLVVARVAQNSGNEQSVRKPSAPPALVAATVSDYSGWLIAELNKSRKNNAGDSMFSQASFDGETFQKFFEFSGAEVSIVLYPVGASGVTGSLESRVGRFKANSVNYYFELGMVAGDTYPADGRPVAVFGRLAEGGYTYRVFMPGEVGHDELKAWLDSHVSVPNPTRMRRALVTTAELSSAWPGNPLLSVTLPGS